LAGEGGGIIGIIVAIIIVGFGASFAILMIASTQTVFNAIIPKNNTLARSAFNNTITPIYSSIPLMALIILALIGGAIIGSLMYYLARPSQ
jgi:hypothetical protein